MISIIIITTIIISIIIIITIIIITTIVIIITSIIIITIIIAIIIITTMTSKQPHVVIVSNVTVADILGIEVSTTGITTAREVPGLVNMEAVFCDRGVQREP